MDVHGRSLARNRVAPTAEILVAPAIRGRWMGNRGCLHEGREIVRPWRSDAWITCETSFRGRHVEQWVPGRYTVLFFHDEAVAFAAGHRPCAECRRPAHNAFLDAWADAFGERPRATELDRRLRADRLDGRAQRRHRRPWGTLPDGVFVAADGAPAVVVGDRVVPWTKLGYGDAMPRPSGSGDAEVLTPAATVEILARGYPVQVDPAA